MQNTSTIDRNERGIAMANALLALAIVGIASMMTFDMAQLSIKSGRMLSSSFDGVSFADEVRQFLNEPGNCFSAIAHSDNGTDINLANNVSIKTLRYSDGSAFREAGTEYKNYQLTLDAMDLIHVSGDDTLLPYDPYPVPTKGSIKFLVSLRLKFTYSGDRIGPKSVVQLIPLSVQVAGQVLAPLFLTACASDTNITDLNSGPGIVIDSKTIPPTISIASDGVDSSMLQADSVSSSEIADNAVQTAKIANDAVTAEKIDSGAVHWTQLNFFYHSSNHSGQGDTSITGTCSGTPDESDNRPFAISCKCQYGAIRKCHIDSGDFDFTAQCSGNWTGLGTPGYLHITATCLRKEP